VELFLGQYIVPNTNHYWSSFRRKKIAIQIIQEPACGMLDKLQDLGLLRPGQASGVQSSVLPEAGGGEE